MSGTANRPSFRDFTFDPRDYNLPVSSAGDVTYTAKKDTPITVGHPPGPQRDEFFLLKQNDHIVFRSSGDIDIVIA